ETSSMSAYDTGSMSAVDASAPPAFGTAPTFGTGVPRGSDTAAPSPFDSGAPSPFDSGTPSPFDSGVPSPFDSSPAPAFNLGSPPATDKETPPAREDSSPSAPAPSSLPAYGAPARGERPVSAGPTGTGNDLPFRTPMTQPKDGIIVPPTASAGAGEEHRLPIFESVESDWFRRGRHGASRAGQVTSVASTSSGGWTSPADEGWRAAEAAHVPTS